MHRSAVLAVLAALTPTANGAMDLTEANFDEKVFKSGKKFTFVKFLAPWCGHCKKLKPDWDKLGEFYNKDDSNALIADVDCTLDEGKKLCEKYGVQGYPTIKYFTKDTSDEGEKYEGPREYNKLKKFVKDNSKDPCVVSTLEHCSKKEKTFIEEFAQWDSAKVTEEAASYEKQIEEATSKHKELSDLFEKQKDEAIATMKQAEEAQKEKDKLSKKLKWKLNLLSQKAEKKEEL